MSLRKIVVVAALASVAFTWANAQTQAPTPMTVPDQGVHATAAPPTPGAPGRSGQDILETSCTGCHDLGVLTATSHTAEDWPVVLKRMVGNGLNITPTDMTTVEAYLVANYSAEPGAH